MTITHTRLIAALAAIALAVLLGLVAWSQWQRAHVARTETRLATGQRGAAIDSGTDAVETVGTAQANEADTQIIVKEGTDAIQQAPGGDSNAAADRAACRLRSYRHSVKCVALLGPAAD